MPSKVADRALKRGEGEGNATKGSANLWAPRGLRQVVLRVVENRLKTKIGIFYVFSGQLSPLLAPFLTLT
jgi:hypothetical protein